MKLTRSILSAALIAACAGSAIAQPTVAEDFGTFSSAQLLTRDVGLTTTQIRWYKVTLPSLPAAGGGYLDIWTAASIPVLGNNDTEIGLYRSTGALVTSDDDDSTGLYSALSYGSNVAISRPAQTGGVIFNGRDGALVPGEYYLALGVFNVTFGSAAFNVTSASTFSGNTLLNLNFFPNVEPVAPSCTVAGTPNPIGNSTGELLTLTVNVAPGQFPTSTAHIVTADTSSLGDPAPQPVTFVESSLNVFTYSLNVANTTPAGTYPIISTVTETSPQNRSSTCTTNIVVSAPTNPTCTFAAAPNRIESVDGGSVALTVRVTPGAAPSSAPHTVTVDTSSLGDASPQPVMLTETSTNVFTYTVNIPAGQPVGVFTLTADVLESGPLARFTSCNTTVRIVQIPGNDLIANAVELSVGASEAGTTIDSSIDTGSPVCSGQTVSAGGVWYFAAGTGNSMTAALCGGPSYDSRLSVYCQQGGQLTCLGGNDDFCGVLSSVTFCSQEGATYFILVHGFSAATGDFQITLSDDSVPCTASIQCIPTGACCLPGSCSIITSDLCAGAGGTYNGDNTTCATFNGVGEDLFVADPAQFPVAIPDLGAAVATLTIPAGSGTLNNVGVRVAMTHTFYADLIGTVSNGSNSVVLFSRQGGAFNAIGNYLFHDFATASLATSGVGLAIPEGNYRSFQTLSALNGVDAAGDWTLIVSDNAGLDVGNLLDFAFVQLDVTSNCAGGCPACAADYDLSGGVDGSDVEAFFIDWSGSAPCADVDQSGGVDGSDVEAFFIIWGAGGC